MRSLTLLTLALTAGATAADSGLSVSSSTSVLQTGQSAQISVSAYFPATAHAFAHADFDVEAGIPAWNFASAGVIAGPDVQGISVGQAHNPFIGIFANPANPIQVWTGTYTPQTNKPLLVPITANPATFSYYPSALTTSSVQAQTQPARKWLFVNPLEISGVAAAPGEGTTLNVGGAGRDILIGGAGPDRAILIGLLCPAVQKVRINTALPPASLTIKTHYDGPVSPSALSFTATVTPSTYKLVPDWPLADEYEYAFHLKGQTIRLRIAATNNRSVLLSRLPLTYAAIPSHDPVALDDYNDWRMRFGSTTPIIDPEGRPLVVDMIEVYAIHHNSSGALTATTHTFEFGVGSSGLSAGKVSMRDFSF